MDGSTVEFTGHGGDELHVHISHPQLTATRVFHRTQDENGNPVLGVHHIRQDTAEEIRGGGRLRFAEQLGHLRAVGVGRITAHGAGDAEGAAAGHDSGFYAWPRFGFQGELSDEQFRSLSPELQRKMDAGGGRTFHHLFDAGGGEQWRAKGTDTESD